MAKPTVDDRIVVGTLIRTPIGFVKVTEVRKHSYTVTAKNVPIRDLWSLWSWEVEWTPTGFTTKVSCT